MNNRSAKVLSLNAVNAWTMAEVGTGRGKKIYKSLIKRKRRILEKRHARKEISLQ